MHRFFRALRPTLHIAHRGGAGLAPENTLVAFRQALQTFRTDMLELDVHLSCDGAVVVSHDATLERCTNGEGTLASHSSAALERLDAGYHFTSDGKTFPFRGQGIRLPHLEEVLRAFPGVPINLELKTTQSGAVETLGELLRREGAVDRILCGSEHDVVGEALQQALPEAAHYLPRDALTGWVLAHRAGETPRTDGRFCTLDMPATYGGVDIVDEALLAAAGAQGLWVNVWTVDEEQAMRRLIALGVGGIMTDRPDRLRAVLDEGALARV